MANIVNNYMTVSLDVNSDGINLACWMSTVFFWNSEREAYPYAYTSMSDRCTWIIHSNAELTVKMLAAVTETADRICTQQIEINAKRRISNR